MTSASSDHTRDQLQEHLLRTRLQKQDVGSESRGARFRRCARECFEPMPVRVATFRVGLVGRASLRSLGREIYGETDPAGVLYADSNDPRIRFDR